MSDISFSKKNGKWYAEFVSDGTELIQIERIRMGDLRIMASIGDMTPVVHAEYLKYAGSANMMFELGAPKGVKVIIWSDSEVKKCRSISIQPPSGGNVDINQASDDSLGGIKTGYSSNGKNYAIQLDDNGNAFVNVPWSDANTTYNKASDSTLGLVKIGYSSNEKNYAVQLDGDGKMYVSVPWTDTTYANATAAKLGLVKQGVAVANASGDAEAKLNELLTSLRNAGIISE